MNKRQRKKHNQKLARIYYTNKIQKALYEFLKGQEKVPCTSEGIDKIKEVILSALTPTYHYTVILPGEIHDVNVHVYVKN